MNKNLIRDLGLFQKWYNQELDLDIIRLKNSIKQLEIHIPIYKKNSKEKRAIIRKLAIDKKLSLKHIKEITGLPYGQIWYAINRV